MGIYMQKLYTDDSAPINVQMRKSMEIYIWERELSNFVMPMFMQREENE